MTATVVTKRAEYLVITAALPGAPPAAIGVLLHDPASNRIGIRLRRDWETFTDEDNREVFVALEDDLREKARTMSPAAFLGWLEDSLSNAVQISDRRPALMAGFEATLSALYRREVSPAVLPFRTHLPVYSLRAAAGRWGENRAVDQGDGQDEWLEAPPGLRLTQDMFAARVVGRSMEPEIPDGAMCVFRAGVTGSRQGRKVLVENFTESEAGGQRYTVKRYRSEKRLTTDGEWSHARIRLEPLNPEFEAWDLDEGAQCRVIAEFVCVLEE